MRYKRNSPHKFKIGNLNETRELQSKFLQLKLCLTLQLYVITYTKKFSDTNLPSLYNPDSKSIQNANQKTNTFQSSTFSNAFR